MKLTNMVRGHKVDHLTISLTTAVAGKAGFTLASAARAVVEFMAKWLNMYPPTVHPFNRDRKFRLKRNRLELSARRGLLFLAAF